MLNIVNVSSKIDGTSKNSGEEIVHIEFQGRVDSTTSKEAEHKIKEIIGARKNLCIMLDFEKLVFISTAGLRVIILLAKECKTNKSRLILVNASNNIREILNIAGFLPSIANEESQIFDSIQESDRYLEDVEAREGGLEQKNTIVLVK